MASKKTSRVSIRDIAKHVGVSIMTVSLSLRNHPKISEPTRNKVKEAAEALGYRPDPEISRLMTRLHDRRSSSDGMPMAIVDFSLVRSTSDVDYGMRVRKGAVNRAEELGYIPSCFYLSEYNGDMERLLSVIRNRGITGVLLLPPVSPVDLPDSLDWSGISVIAATYAISPPKFHRVVPHQFVDMSRLINQLKQRGYKKIGALFEHDFEERTYFNFTGSFMLHHCNEYIYRTKPGQMDEAKLTCFVDWLKDKQPEVIISPFAQFAQETVKKQQKDRTLKLPLFVGWGGAKNPDISFWDERPEEIGADAAVMLAGMMQHHEYGVPESPRTTLLHGRFNDAPLGPVKDKAESKTAARESAKKGGRKTKATAG